MKTLGIGTVIRDENEIVIYYDDTEMTFPGTISFSDGGDIQIQWDNLSETVEHSYNIKEIGMIVYQEIPIASIDDSIRRDMFEIWIYKKDKVSYSPKNNLSDYTMELKLSIPSKDDFIKIKSYLESFQVFTVERSTIEG